MPRMSIDSKFGRDPRVLRLAKACGWSRREAMGALLDVWEVSYERIDHVIPPADIDAAAELDGFAERLVACGLGRVVKRGVHVAGAKERIAYRKRKSAAGTRGGIKSGESRRNSPKQNTTSASHETPSASCETNPSASASAPDTASDPEREAEAPAPAAPPPPLSLVPPVGWIPEWTGALEQARRAAAARGVDVATTVASFKVFADLRRWSDAERPARLAAWFARERTPSAKERQARTDAQPRPKPKPDTPPTRVPLSDEERDEVRRLAQQLATNPIAAATALKETP